MSDEQNRFVYELGEGAEYESGTVSIDSRTNAVFLRSIVFTPKQYGFVSTVLDPETYKGKRLKISAWIKTDLAQKSSVQLWLRADGDWTVRSECFDNMFQRRVFGKTDWAQHEVSIEVPEGCNKILFGMLLNGAGQAWLDDVTIELSDSSPAAPPRKLRM